MKLPRAKQKSWFVVAASLLVLVGWSAKPALACDSSLQSCSSNYGVNEVFFGSGGGTGFSSSNYQAQVSVGETGVGNSTSANYQTHAGFNTAREPYIELDVNTANITLPVLTVAAPQTTTATFSVKSYLSSGYIVTSASPPPTNSSYTMNALSSPTTSSPGSEQFGINLVANNSCGGGLPASLGADKVQIPDSTFSFGGPASGYDTACNFKYVQDGTIASSASSSGETDYTISYLFNVSNLTPGGTYSFNQVLVATATY